MYTNIANYIYEIFETTRDLKLPDITLGLAHLMSVKAIPEGIESQELREFMGKHYRGIVALFNRDSKEEFVDIVSSMAADYWVPEEADAE